MPALSQVRSLHFPALAAATADEGRPPPRQYDYLFAFGVIFATLDAAMIGANDVANSWATSVSSRSLTLRQAVLGAAVFEFLVRVVASRFERTLTGLRRVPSWWARESRGKQTPA